jgi:hypothetical protein
VPAQRSISIQRRTATRRSSRYSPLGIAATRPTLIQGTAAADLLTATASGQTITGLGGADTLSGGSFTGIDFKDLTANLNGCTIQAFVTSDRLDFTDMNAGSMTVRYVAGSLSIPTARTPQRWGSVSFIRP